MALQKVGKILIKSVKYIDIGILYRGKPGKKGEGASSLECFLRKGVVQLVQSNRFVRGVKLAAIVGGAHYRNSLTLKTAIRSV